MRQIEDARKRYEEIPIPAELSGRVRAAIVRSEEKRKSQRQRIPTVRIRRKHRIWGTCAGMAAALVLVFTTALNTNTAFAEMAAGLPVIGAAARILTFRSYERDEGDWKISVEIPSVEMIAKDTNGLDSIRKYTIYAASMQTRQWNAPGNIRRRLWKLEEQRRSGKHMILTFMWDMKSRPRQRRIFPLRYRELRTGPRPTVKQNITILI